jgi:predicted DNA binding CopG/RHH family protein
VRLGVTRLPKFASEREEAEFWATHDSTQYLDHSEAVEATFEDVRPRKTQISLRLDAESIAELRTVARRKGVGYQTLIRMWVMERLAQERPGA